MRCTRGEGPTPYLRDSMKYMPPVVPKVLDIGCGNGRNSRFMQEQGYEIVPVDMCDDFGVKLVLGKDDLPKGPFDIILANYVLMFLDDKERRKVFKDIQKVSKPGTVLVIEMYEAQDAHPYDFDEMVDTLLKSGWIKRRRSKDKCILMRV